MLLLKVEIWEYNADLDIYISNMGQIYNSKSNILCGIGKHGSNYLHIKLYGKYYKVHRLVAEMFCKKPPDYDKVFYDVDHINGNKRDNRACNLRFVTCQQNNINKRVGKNNELQIKGITLMPSGKYRVRIQCNEKRIYGGLFNTLEEACKKRLELAKEMFGEYMHPINP